MIVTGLQRKSFLIISTRYAFKIDLSEEVLRQSTIPLPTGKLALILFPAALIICSQMTDARILCQNMEYNFVVISICHFIVTNVHLVKRYRN